MERWIDGKKRLKGVSSQGWIVFWELWGGGALICETGNAVFLDGVVSGLQGED